MCTEGPAPEVTGGCWHFRTPEGAWGASDDRQQVAARCLRALQTTIEEPGVQAKRGKAFKRRWLVLIPEASCCHVKRVTEEAGGSCDGFRGQEEGWSREIRPGRPSQQDKALKRVLATVPPALVQCG